MDPRNAARDPDPDAVEFVRFCYRRRRVGWPELYDEMCAVAGRGLFRGYSADDLAGLGIGFSLFDMPALAGLAAKVVAEEVALRRPVRVTLAVDPAPVAVTDVRAAEVAVTAVEASPIRVIEEPVDDRSVDVPIRFAVAPAGA